MRRTICSIIIFLSIKFSIAQTSSQTTQCSFPIEMLFPEAKSKAIILSYDDGRIQDRQLVKLMNKYNLKGTFHLNSNKLGTADYLTKNEIKALFKLPDKRNGLSIW